ncbi:hypothetical protein Sango_0868800 [Sesamum angolense]|uniref:DUF6821 domain-containing protein n=1 Tax=Sesamum angolense TaxID=2727404 RepID=A0AAE2C0Y0_9LAMI|nr:hypothetical protein Sango_0868800 [Sesamum angolense]
MDYFICPPQLLPKTIHPPQPTIPHLQLPDHQPLLTKTPLPIPPAQASARINTSFTTSADQHPVSPDKFYETGLMMTLDSKTTWVIMPQAQTEGAGVFHFQEKKDPCKDDSITSVIKKNDKKLLFELEGGFNIWKWSFNGLGAICSFGVAAATFCLIINFSTHRNKNILTRIRAFNFRFTTVTRFISQHPSCFLRHYFSHSVMNLLLDQTIHPVRMKQVIHQASMLSEAGRGVGITTSGGGYYDDAAV